jgi:hypothetical protein
MFFWHRLFFSPYKQAMKECDWENCSILLFMDVTVTRRESRQLGQNISKSSKLQLTSDARDQDSKFRVYVRNLGDLCIVYHLDFSCPTWPEADTSVPLFSTLATTAVHISFLHLLSLHGMFLDPVCGGALQVWSDDTKLYGVTEF